MSDPRAGTGEPTGLSLDAEGFYLQHHRPYHAYAYVRLGDGRGTDRLVHEVFADIACDWEAMLRAANLQDRCWHVLRSAVDHRSAQTPGRFEARLALGYAALLDAAPAAQAVPVELFKSVGELTERQLDVLILRRVLGYDLPYTAWILGVPQRGVVERDLRSALARLEGALDRPRIPAQHDPQQKLDRVFAEFAAIRESLTAMQSPVGLYKAMADLGDRRMGVFLLRKVMGFSSRYTAWLLDVTVSTVDRDLHSAMAQVEEALVERRVLRAANEMLAEGEQ
ncbi:hypothetical protein ACEZDB_33825 [Streptacidiphilus sp. N1-3]|uniref:Uncharacterized protein n=1 Tax=Streptacidiphilus alkalitolerans TaxID=3342712 RepID=A0ABV6XBG8_9ACTN